MGVLHYIVSRLSASSTVQAAQQSRRLDGFDDTGAGVFLNLSCGHNNPFSKEEKLRLEVLLNRSASRQNDEVV